MTVKKEFVTVAELMVVRRMGIDLMLRTSGLKKKGWYGGHNEKLKSKGSSRPLRGEERGEKTSKQRRGEKGKRKEGEKIHLVESKNLLKKKKKKKKKKGTCEEHQTGGKLPKHDGEARRGRTS